MTKIRNLFRLHLELVIRIFFFKFSFFIDLKVIVLENFNIHRLVWFGNLIKPKQKRKNYMHKKEKKKKTYEVCKFY